MVKVGCVFYTDTPRYDKLLEVAIKSFKNFHKQENIKVFIFNNSHCKKFGIDSRLPPGIIKYLFGHVSMEVFKCDKTIILGADTITCDRLSEFLDDNESDILCSLDYCYKIPLDIKNSNNENHVNADVVCFNNKKALLDCLNIYNFLQTPYYEQGCLNYLLFSEKYNYKFKIVDYPYPQSKVCYNVRSKGNIAAEEGEKPWGPFVEKFTTKNNKLYDFNNNQIKVFHYCEGLGNLNNVLFCKLINDWIFKYFNNETKQFFKENTGTDFFDKEFQL